jgi:hypothetical protein
MSELKVVGKITKIKEKVTGEKKDGSGTWEKIEFLLDNNEKYNNLFCFEMFGEEKVENLLKYNKVGDQVEVTFNVSCNEYKEKHYTSLSAWKVFKAEGSNSEDTFESKPKELVTDDQSGDLPF